MSQKLSSRPLAGISLALLFAGCAVGGPALAETEQGTSTAINSSAFASEQSYQMYNVMLAEMLVRNGQLEQAAEHYAAAASESRDPELVRRAAELALQSENTDLAGELLERWSRLEPESVDARQYRILLRTRLKQYDEAVDDVVWVRDYMEKKDGHGFEYVVSLLALEAGAADTYEVFRRYAGKVDNSARVQLVVASMALNADRPEQALEAGKLAVAGGDKAQKEQALRVEAKALIALKRPDEAIAVLEPVIKETDDTNLKLEFGRMLIMADRRDEARPLFMQLYKSQPDNTDILYTLGLLYLEQEEFAFAEPLMQKLLEVPGRKYEASYFLGQIYEGQKRYDDALKAYEDAVNGDFAREAIGRVSALIQQEKGLDAAREWLAAQMKEASIDGRKVMLLMAEGQLLHDAGKYQEAVDAYTQAAAFGSSRRDVLYARSLSYDRMGKVEQAEADLGELIRDDPADADALNALGYMLTISTGRYDEALELIGKALELQPESPAILDSMGWVLFKQGDLAGAEKYLRQAFEKMRDPEIASHLVEVLSRNGKPEEAQKILTEMLARHPDDKMLVEVRSKLADMDMTGKAN
ncbi:MAG TPA: tetratricopeptide repeat protein [Thiolinea sp.]|nr:tetratricopeptide repeat protein [Thiolinea sp.]